MNEQIKKTSINDIVKATGFSKGTVSKALNNKGRVSEATRKLILEKAKEMNFIASYHAQALSTNKSWLIGVIFPENIGIGLNHPFFSVVLDGFKKSVEKLGYEIVFINRKLARNRMSYYDYCKYRNVDGVLVVTFNHSDPQLFDLINSDIPVVCTDLPGVDAVSVVSDDYIGGKMATDYLFSLGHTKIAHLSGPHTMAAGLNRFKGFEASMKEHGYDRFHIYGANNFSYDDGYHTTLHIIESGYLPEAMFIASDWMAMGAIRAFKENGIRVPEDISIIGYDNVEFFRYNTPQLSTINQNAIGIGEIAAESLYKMIQGEEVTSTKVPVEVVERETCKKK